MKQLNLQKEFIKTMQGNKFESVNKLIKACNDFGKAMLLIDKHITSPLLEKMREQAEEDEKQFIENASTGDGTSQ